MLLGVIQRPTDDCDVLDPDVEKPAVLAAQHPLYFGRLLLGPNYRADVWAALDEQPDATPAQVARMVGCAYETARSVAKDWALAQSVERSR